MHIAAAAATAAASDATFVKLACDWRWLPSWLLLGSPTTPTPPSSSPPTARQVRSAPLAPVSALALPRLLGFLRALGSPALEVETVPCF
eukprot:6965109-Pyramimonas_sp.AAC.1